MCDFHKVHRFACMIVDAQDADKQKCRATHKHKGELHCSIVLVAATPHTDEQIHRDECHLVEHKHREQVNRNEEAEHTGGQENEPQEILLRERLNLPRSESAGKHDDS